MEVKMGKVRKWRRHTEEFKRQVVEKMKTSQNIHALAKELQLERKLLYTWRNQLEGRSEPRHANLQETAEERNEKRLRKEIDQLKKALGQKALEIDFFKDALFRTSQTRQQDGVDGGKASTKPSGRGRQSKAN
jgi:transposase-like protein